MEEIKKQVEEKIKLISEQGIKSENLELLGELVDIHKDLENEEYWKEKKEVMKMNYRGYGNYNEDGYGTGGYNTGGYSEGGYGRRGRKRGRGRYRGEEMMEEMHEAYQEYSEGKEQYGRGNYGAQSATMKSLDYMLQSVTEFLEMLKKEASSQEEMQLIQKYTREISEM